MSMEDHENHEQVNVYKSWEVHKSEVDSPALGFFETQSLPDPVSEIVTKFKADVHRQVHTSLNLKVSGEGYQGK